MTSRNDASVVRSLTAWQGCRIIRPLEGGFRNHVYLAERDGEFLVVKTTRRSEAALTWLLDVQERAREVGFIVPEFVLSDQGCVVIEGITVEKFVTGEALSGLERPELSRLINAFHAATLDISQRPGFASAKDLLSVAQGGDVDFRPMPPALVARCREAWRHLPDEPSAVVHSDLNLGNLLETPGGHIALLDWDETRVDVPFFDTAVLRQERLKPWEKQILTAWEVAVSWQIEPKYARQQALELRRHD